MVPKVIGDLPYGECAITRIGVGRPCQKTAIYSSVQKNMLCFHSMNIWMKPPEIQKKKNQKCKSLTVYHTISLKIQIRILLNFFFNITWIKNTFTVWNTIIWTILHCFWLFLLTYFFIFVQLTTRIIFIWFMLSNCGYLCMNFNM